MFLHHKIGKKRLNFDPIDFGRMTLIVEKNVTFDPMNVAFRGLAE